LNHTFRKRWGQNFLNDPNIIDKLLQALQPDKNDCVLEIGPGNGALTIPLSGMVSSIIAVEIDPHLIHELDRKTPDTVCIHQADFLEFDTGLCPTPYKVLGNLPYYVTTPVIFKILAAPGWTQAVFTIQKEVAQRISAPSGTRVYGRLSVMAQLQSEIEYLFTVPRTVFYPQPGVDSAVIRLTRRAENFPLSDLLAEIIRAAFGQRRKKLRNTITSYLCRETMIAFGDLRPEQLSPADFKRIASTYQAGS